jgi:hypothetical protein
MKTAMQELLQVESDLTRMFDSDLRVAIMLLEHLRANKTEMLEKEKGQMIDFALNFMREDNTCESYRRESAFDFFDKTFNTDEK